MTFPLTGKDFDLKKQKREQQRSIRNLKIAIYHLNAVKKRERDHTTARGIDDAIDALKATMDGAHNRIDALNQELKKL